MPDLKVQSRSPDANQCVLEVTPSSAGWTYVGFAVHTLTAGSTVERMFEDRETCLIVLSGNVDVQAGDEQFSGIGGRSSVFENVPPDAVYVPGNTRMRITSQGGAEIAICTAPSSGDHGVRRISPDSISIEERGEGTNRRIVRNILPETEPADSLLIAEVITPGGNWSSYPPHKHDSDRVPEESALEETYYHRVDPPQGFAFQRVYTDDRSIDETMTVEDGDCVLVPRGYHPVGAPHGYTLYYLNVMAGPKRTWIFKNDPQHEWLLR